MNCRVFREMLDPYLGESLEADQRMWFRDHLTTCDSCQDWAIGQDPSLLFAATEPPAIDAVMVESCAMAVTNQIRQHRLEKRLHRRSRPWIAAAAAAVVLIGGGLAWRIAPNWGGDATIAVVEESSEDQSTRTPPSVEVEMSGEDVRVYQFAADDSDTAVVFVVNPSLEL